MRATAIFLVVLGFTFGHSIAAYAQLDSQTNTQAGAQALVGKTEVSEQGSASTSTSAESRPANAELSSGTTVNAVLQTPVDSKKAKSGDRVDARTTEAVTSDGKTVLPKRTKLVGHVTRASARAKGDAESTLAIAFDRAVLKNGRELPLNVVIQAIASGRTTAPAAEDMGEISSISGTSSGSAVAGSHSALGGVTGAAGSVSSAGTQLGHAAGGAVNSTVNSTAGIAGSSAGAVDGLNAAGQLGSNSHGVIGLNGLSLNSAMSGSGRGSVITSAGKNVHLDSGTRMLLVTQASASANQDQ